VGRRVGAGSFGEVFTADWNGTEVALKQMHNKNVTGESVEEFAGEIRMMQGMRHPNVVLFLGKAFPIYYPFRLPEYCSVWSTVGKYYPSCLPFPIPHT
jgi:serine/threonine protein kinase